MHPSLAALLPHDTVALAVFHVDALKTGPLYQKWIAPRMLARWSELARQSGFDPQKDLVEAVVASDGKQALVLARGRFAPDKIGRELERSGARKSLYRKYALYGDEEAVVVFVDRETAVAGPPALIRALLDRPRSGGMPARLREKTKSVPAGSQIWAVSLAASPFGTAALPFNSAPVLERLFHSVESVWAGADLRSGLNMTVEWTCRTKDEGKLLHDALRGLIGMGRLSTPDSDRELLRFYDSIRVSQRESVVRMETELAPDLLDQFLRRMEGRTRQR